MTDGVRKHNLLLIDGDPKSQRVLEVSLKKAGFDVIAAPDAPAALARLGERTPDLIISDTQLAGVDGFELCRRVKETPELARVPFIFLSSKKSIEDKIRGLELGVEDYLIKPIYIKEITTRVRILLQRRERESLESGRDARTRFSGQLADIGVVDLVQTIDINRKSGIVHIESPDGRRGAIYFRDGRVIDAEAGRLSGLDAVYRLFSWSEGRFEVEFKPLRRRDVVELPVQALLIEGMRRLDEWSHQLESLPPLDTVLQVDYHVLAERLAEIPDEVNLVLRLCDGRRTLTQVIEDAELPDLDTVAAIAKLRRDQVLYEPRGERVPVEVRGSMGRLERWLSDAPWASSEATPVPEARPVIAGDQPTARMHTLYGVGGPAPPAEAPVPRTRSPEPPDETLRTLPGYATSPAADRTAGDIARAVADGETLPFEGRRKERINTSPYGMPAAADEEDFTTSGRRSVSGQLQIPEEQLPHVTTETFFTPPEKAARARNAMATQAMAEEGRTPGPSAEFRALAQDLARGSDADASEVTVEARAIEPKPAPAAVVEATPAGRAGGEPAPEALAPAAAPGAEDAQALAGAPDDSDGDDGDEHDGDGDGDDHDADDDEHDESGELAAVPTQKQRDRDRSTDDEPTPSLLPLRAARAAGSSDGESGGDPAGSSAGVAPAPARLGDERGGTSLIYPAASDSDELVHARVVVESRPVAKEAVTAPVTETQAEAADAPARAPAKESRPTRIGVPSSSESVEAMSRDEMLDELGQRPSRGRWLAVGGLLGLGAAIYFFGLRSSPAPPALVDRSTAPLPSAPSPPSSSRLPPVELPSAAGVTKAPLPAAPAPPDPAVSPPASAGNPQPSPAPALPSGSARAESATPARVPGAGVTASPGEPRAATADVAQLEEACAAAYKKQRYKDIVAACGALAEARPAHAQAMINVAHAELERGNTRQALIWARKAVEAGPDLAEAWVFIGGAEQELGNKPAAKLAYQKYLELAPAGRYARELRIIVDSL